MQHATGTRYVLLHRAQSVHHAEEANVPGPARTKSAAPLVIPGRYFGTRGFFFFPLFFFQIFYVLAKLHIVSPPLFLFFGVHRGGGGGAGGQEVLSVAISEHVNACLAFFFFSS